MFHGAGVDAEGRGQPFVAVYAATPPTSHTIALADIVVQRSTDNGVTWTSPLAIDDDPPEMMATGFYPQLNVSPNGRVDVSWQDNRETTDFHFDVRYTYSTDGGLTWAKNIKVNDKPNNFNYGVSYNSDLRQPGGVASADEYAILGWGPDSDAGQLRRRRAVRAAANEEEHHRPGRRRHLRWTGRRRRRFRDPPGPQTTELTRPSRATGGNVNHGVRRRTAAASTTTPEHT